MLICERLIADMDIFFGTTERASNTNCSWRRLSTEIDISQLLFAIQFALTMKDFYVIAKITLFGKEHYSYRERVMSYNARTVFQFLVVASTFNFLS